jgi:hypothetical protein
VKTIAIILISQLISIQLIYAQEAVYLKKGEKVPFDGLLLSKEAQAKVLAEQEKQKEQCGLDKNYLKMRQEENCKHSINLKKIENEALEEKLNSLLKIKQDEINRLQDIAVKDKSDFWKNLYFVLGFVSGSLIVIGSAALIKNVN